MYQIELYSGEKYWITENEAIQMANEMSKPFVQFKRRKKMINTKNIKEIGVPDFIFIQQQKGHEILFRNGTPTILGEDYYLEYEGDGWKKFDGARNRKMYVTFDEYIGEVKKLA